MRAAVISDTHLPRGRRALPPACLAELRAAELIVHAGDLIAPEVLTELQALGPVLAVHGNVDLPAVRGALPEQVEVELEGVRLAVVHDAGPARGRAARMRRRFPTADAVVFGHSHIPLHEHDQALGLQLFNPGSPTDRRRQPRHTMGVAEIAAGEVDFRLLALD